LEPNAWQWFGLARGMPSVSVADYGLTLNAAAAELLGEPAFLAVGLNPERRLLALRPLSAEDVDGVKSPLPFPGRSRGDIIRINSRDLVRTLRHYLMLDESAGRYLCRWDDNDRLLVVDFNVRLDVVHEQARTDVSGGDSGLDS